jgi:hypothetical protein
VTRLPTTRDDARVANWRDLEQAEQAFADSVRARFEATGLAMLATLRSDGSPRLSGIEPWFADGELWLGMMYDSRKARDLQRDPRFALHAATIDKDVSEGDVKVAGRAFEIGEDEVADALAAYAAQAGHDAPPGPAHVFKLDLHEVVHIAPAGDHLVIQRWTPVEGLTQVDRY